MTDEGEDLINAKHRPILGTVLGLVSASGMGFYSVALRTIEGDASFRTGIAVSFYAALLMVIGSSCAMLAASVGTDADVGPLATPVQNINLSMAHGATLLSGFVCYTRGARYLPAAEAVLLAQSEVPLGILNGILFVGEVPTGLGAIGCVVTALAVGWHSVATCRKGANGDDGERSPDEEEEDGGSSDGAKQPGARGWDPPPAGAAAVVGGDAGQLTAV